MGVGKDFCAQDMEFRFSKCPVFVRIKRFFQLSVNEISANGI